LTARKARIDWPEYVGLETPAIVIDLLGGGRTNIGNSHSSANFRSFGAMRVAVFDTVSNRDDMQASEDAFGTKFFTLIDELVEKATDEGPLVISSLDYEDDPITQSYENVAHAQDSDDDQIDDAATLRQMFLVGVFVVRTGVVR
jgi:hypothetical protein